MWVNDTSIFRNSIKCSACLDGYYWKQESCYKCSEAISNCLLCSYVSSSNQVYCEKCSSGSGYNCGSQTCSLSDCREPWLMRIPLTCYCKSCTTSRAEYSDQIGSLFKSCLPSISPIPSNCLTNSNSPSANNCIQCRMGHVKSNGQCFSTTGWNCEPGSITYSNGEISCQVSAAHFFHIDRDNPPISVSIPVGGCKVYKSILTSAPYSARCVQCEKGKIIEFTSPSYYTCKHCSLQTAKLNCLHTVSYNGVCYCGKCVTNDNGIHYVMKPDMSGCLSCNIPLCSEHTSQLVSRSYVCRCKTCISNVYLINEDGSGCVDCSSASCQSGIKYIENNICKCKCPTDFLLNKEGSACIACGSTNIANCQSRKYYLEKNVCKCSQCIDGFILSANSLACLSCQTSPGAGMPNCRACTADQNIFSATSSCSGCDNNYGINLLGNFKKGSCIKCEPGCKFCSVNDGGSTKNLCKECLPGYSLNDQNVCIQCPQTPVACTDCIVDEFDNSKTLCKQFSCSGTAALRDSDFKCEICSISNCLHCHKEISGKFICLQCKKSFFIDSTGLCKPCVSGCDFCLDAYKCLLDGCKEGFIRHKLTGYCIECPGDGVSKCEYQSLYNTSLIPKICKSGYVLNIALTPNKCDSK